MFLVFFNFLQRAKKRLKTIKVRASNGNLLRFQPETKIKLTTAAHCPNRKTSSWPATCRRHSTWTRWPRPTLSSWPPWRHRRRSTRFSTRSPTARARVSSGWSTRSQEMTLSRKDSRFVCLSVCVWAGSFSCLCVCFVGSLNLSLSAWLLVIFGVCQVVNLLICRLVFC